MFLFHVLTRLKHLDDMLSSACLSAEAVYKVLYWDDHVKSSRFVSRLLLHTHTHTQNNPHTHTQFKEKFLKKIVQCWSESGVNVGAFLRKRLRIYFFVDLRFYNSILGNYSIPKSAPVNLHLSTFVCTLTLAVFCSRFFGGMLLLVCLLYVTPVGWVLAGVNSTIFLWNRDFCRG